MTPRAEGPMTAHLSVMALSRRLVCPPHPPPSRPKSAQFSTPAVQSPEGAGWTGETCPRGTQHPHSPPSQVLSIPGFPEFNLAVRLVSPDVVGEALANYATRLHHSMAERGVFSPRLMHFLEVQGGREGRGWVTGRGREGRGWVTGRGSRERGRDARPCWFVRPNQPKRVSTVLVLSPVWKPNRAKRALTTNRR